LRLGELGQARSVALSYTRVWQCKLRYGKAGEVGSVGECSGKIEVWQVR